MSSPPNEIAERIRALGPVIDPPGTARIYADILAHQPTDGVDVIPNIRYGNGTRQSLDVYRPVATSGSVPVVLFFHGGGYSRGDKSDRSNVGYFFARNGVTAFIANYGLAPECKWPSGARDVIAALRWAQENAQDHGGDPRRICLLGESAGAAHVALASFVSTFHKGRPLRAAGVVLQSGSYNVALERVAAAAFGIPSPDLRNQAYFGEETARYLEMSTTRLIDAPDVPTLITYAEYDPVPMQVQAGELFATLALRASHCPLLLRLLGHGHISQFSSYNTVDTSVSGRVLDFAKSLPRVQ
ncbi:alpha/beta hydrolase (plasmid) [Bradyrhizobium sp. CCBAU 53351]|nr:alpha/beta hydrolase [Bradyrhizobium guangdongense]QAU50504.1 alpha/beta hydrolase [Bradyrhizobium guangzhouense]QOZ49223.1 alpha/beta hydrolase [Bradyrhizobium sp. CCBAU 53340]QOZ57029.1 alpha/beta hydrolase [Bradyrhizobium sp. CCBAU 53338]QOZ80984.1 alpha/beta hydrolase [Bradyrhizobium sp. CCBAU 53351]